jgi:hypothetical protein
MGASEDGLRAAALPKKEGENRRDELASTDDGGRRLREKENS